MTEICDRPQGQLLEKPLFEVVLPKGVLAHTLSRDQQREIVLQENEQMRQIIKNLIGSMQTKWMSLSTAIDRLNEVEKDFLLAHVGLVDIKGTFFLACREDDQRFSAIDALTALYDFMNSNRHTTLLGALLSLDMDMQNVLRQYISYSY